MRDSDRPTRLHIRGMGKVRGDTHRKVRIDIPEFRVRAGEFVAVVGPNGSGKSTLLDMLGLILSPDYVEEFVLHEDPPYNLGTLTPREKIQVRRRFLAYALQRGGLLEFLSIRENIRFSARLKDRPPEKMAEVVKLLELEDFLDKRPGKTSGGQRQKAVIACALVQEPHIILADEPTSALDPPSARKLIETFRGLAKEAGISLIMVTHAWELIQGCAETIYQFNVKEESHCLLHSLLMRTTSEMETRGEVSDVLP